MMTETVREERTMRVITQISLTDTATGNWDLKQKYLHQFCSPVLPAPAR